MSRIPVAFQEYVVSVPLEWIKPQTEFNAESMKSGVYKQIFSSVREIGLIEPLVVYPRSPNDYLLLDGHIRLEALKDSGATDARCILAKDDESYTYNRRVNSIPPIAQHLMLLEALRNGLTEERIAASLQVDVSVIRQKRDMLNGICEEAIELLRDRKLNSHVFHYLRKMKPYRQIEVVEHMIANSSYSLSFVKALLYATRPELLIDVPKARAQNTSQDIGRPLLMQESESLMRDLKKLEGSYGKNVLELAVCQPYIQRLLKNARVVRYLERKHKETLVVMQAWLKQRKLAASQT
jgi:hypothetical protein